MVDVTSRLCEAVAPGGHLLVVGHAPGEAFTHLSDGHRRAMWLAEDLLPASGDDFEPLVAEQRPRTVTRNGGTWTSTTPRCSRAGLRCRARSAGRSR